MNPGLHQSMAPSFEFTVIGVLIWLRCKPRTKGRVVTRSLHHFVCMRLEVFQDSAVPVPEAMNSIKLHVQAGQTMIKTSAKPVFALS